MFEVGQETLPATEDGADSHHAPTPSRPLLGRGWQAELRPHDIRVICICPSEVQTAWGGRTGRNNPNKLYASDIADAILAALSANRRALWPELAVFATNPWREEV